MPPIYGTAWKGADTYAKTLLALQCGFRAIDTANQPPNYREQEVGAAVRDFCAQTGGQRSAIFVQTKFTFAKDQSTPPYDPSTSIFEQVLQSFYSSLQHLGGVKIDALLLHTLANGQTFAEEDLQAWRALEALCNEGKIGYLGVSNYPTAALKTLLANAVVKPAIIQNLALWRARWDDECRQFCAANGIVYQAYGLLAAKQDGLPLYPIRWLADKYKATWAQILFRFADQLHMRPLVGTGCEVHMREALVTPHFSLQENEVEMLLRMSGHR